MSEPGRDLYMTIKDMAKELGFADFGCACAGPVTDVCRKNYLQAMEKGYFAGMQYLHNNLEKRFNPTLLVESATTHGGNKLYGSVALIKRPTTSAS